jgi:hypothetical protein
MSTPTGDNGFLHELELTVRAELTLAETSQPQEEAFSEPIDEWLSDPADTQRYEVGLRTLFGAVEVLEDPSGPGGHHPLTEMAEGVITAGHLPDEPGPGISRASAQQAGTAIE